jgi:outer membrane protein assembly factor BamB
MSKEEPGDEKDLIRHVSCYQLADGTSVWSVPTKPALPEQIYQGFQALHGYASSTPVSDGKALFIFFGKSGAAGLSFSGKPLWATKVGAATHGWGSGTSPLVHEDLVIVNASVESKSLVALDKRDGREVWRVEGVDSSWSTPALIPTAGGSTELVVSMKAQIIGLNPTTGEQLWRCEGIQDYVCPAVLGEAGIAYVIGGRANRAIAVRTGGRGDVTASHRLWEIRSGSNVSSPVFHQGHLYWASETKGICYCAKAGTGELVYEERLDPRPGRIYASPLLADGKIYYVSRENGTFVLAAEPELKLVAHVEPLDNSIHNASMCVGGGKLLLRSDEYLYCIGE